MWLASRNAAAGALGETGAGVSDPAALNQQVQQLMERATEDPDESSGSTVMGKGAMRAVLAACVSEWQRERASGDGDAAAGIGLTTPQRPSVVPRLDLSRVTGASPASTPPPKRMAGRRADSEPLVFHHLGLYPADVSLLHHSSPGSTGGDSHVASSMFTQPRCVACSLACTMTPPIGS